LFKLHERAIQLCGRISTLKYQWQNYKRISPSISSSVEFPIINEPCSLNPCKLSLTSWAVGEAGGKNQSAIRVKEPKKAGSRMQDRMRLLTLNGISLELVTYLLEL